MKVATQFFMHLMKKEEKVATAYHRALRNVNGNMLLGLTTLQVLSVAKSYTQDGDKWHKTLALQMTLKERG